MILHLKNREIDKQKWDECIRSCDYGYIYAQSWMLDIVSPNWEAFVEDDYKTIMPLPLKQKFGIRYIVQPYFTQQLGIFSASPVGKDLFNEFFTKLLRHVKLIALNFNQSNLMVLNAEKETRQTQVLKLDKSYDLLFQGYSGSIKKNLRVSVKKNISVRSNTTVEEILKILAKDKPELWNENSKKLAIKLMNVALKQGFGKIYGAYSGDLLISACFFMFDTRRIYSLFHATSELGISSKSKFLIHDKLINDYAGSGLTLDFMGSMIPGIRFVNNGLGGTDVSYVHVKINRLPFPLNLLRR